MKLEEVKTYHDSGKLWMHYFHDEQKRAQGKFISYYEDSSISREVDYKDNKYHGKYIDYYDGAICNINYFWYDKQVTKAEFLRLKYDEAMKCS